MTNRNIFLLNENNLDFEVYEKASLIYADCIFESLDFVWMSLFWQKLKPNGIFMVQTDYHTVAQAKLYLDSLPDATLVNWAVYKQEWGGVPKKGFSRKHDDILIYCKGEDFTWHGDRVQIPKATAGTALDKKGTGTKTPCDVFDDLGNFMTTSPERIKTADGKNIKWQKPLKLMRRLIYPFVNKGDLIIDPFAGTATTGVVAMEMDCDFIGIENDETVFGIGLSRLLDIVLSDPSKNYISTRNIKSRWHLSYWDK